MQANKKECSPQSKEFIDESLQAFKDMMISRIRSEHDQIYK